MRLITVALTVALVAFVSSTTIGRTYLPPVRQSTVVHRPQGIVQTSVVRPASVYLPPSSQVVTVSRPAARVASNSLSFPQVLSIARPIEHVAIQRPEPVYLPPSPQRVVTERLRPALQVISHIAGPVAPQRTYLPPKIGAASWLNEQTNEL